MAIYENTNLQEDYVSFETAKLLKEKGFDEHGKSYYTESGLEGYMLALKATKNTELDNGFISRPTLQMAMKWLREVHHITIGIDFTLNIITYEIQKDGEFITAIGSSRSYEDMVEEAIKYCLEKLV